MTEATKNEDDSAFAESCTEAASATAPSPTEPDAKSETAAAPESTEAADDGATAAVETGKAADDAAPAATDASDPEPVEPAGRLGRLGTGIAAAMPDRSALMAGGLGLMAGIALLGGTFAVMGSGRPSATPNPVEASANAAQEARALKGTVAKLETRVAELKASIDASRRQAAAQRAKTADPAQAHGRSQAEMQTQLTKIADTIKRLEKRVAAVVATETTGSIAPQQKQQQQKQQKQPATGAKAPPEPRVARGWRIRDVFGGRAVVASRRGVFEAAPGLYLPGLGQVEAITRQDGDWVVVTENGIIMDARRRRSSRRH